MRKTVQPYDWANMSAEEMTLIIKTEFVEVRPEVFTGDFFRGMNHYLKKYGGDKRILAQMVLIDIARGANVCSCCQPTSH
jgi:hypothetical protein